MSVSSVIDSARSGMDTQRRLMKVVADNVSNADRPWYSRLDAKVSRDSPSSVYVSRVDRQSDELLNYELRNHESEFGYVSKMSDYYSRIEDLLGEPDASDKLGGARVGDNLILRLGDFFSSVHLLALDPTDDTTVARVVRNLSDLVDDISGIALDLNEIMLHVSLEIEDKVKELNTKFQYLGELQEKISGVQEGTEDAAYFDDEFSKTLMETYRLLNFSSVDDSGFMLNTVGGAIGSFWDGIRLHYDGPKSLSEVLKEDYVFPDLKAFLVRSNDGLDVGETGFNAVFDHGEIGALMRLRDVELPNLLHSLDSFAYTFSHALNEISSRGYAFPDLKQYISVKEVRKEEKPQYEGLLKLILVDKYGEQLKYSDWDGYVQPMYLDLSKIEDFESFNRAVNSYFLQHDRSGPVIPGFGDLQLVVDGYKGHGLSFDLDFDNQEAADKLLMLDDLEAYYQDSMGEKHYLAIEDLEHVQQQIKAGGCERGLADLDLDLDLRELPSSVDRVFIELSITLDESPHKLVYNLYPKTIQEFDRVPATSIDSESFGMTDAISYVSAEFVDENGAVISRNDRQIPTYLSIRSLDPDVRLVIDSSSTHVVNNEDVTFSHDMGFGRIVSELDRVEGSAMSLANCIDDVHNFPRFDILEVEKNRWQIGFGSAVTIRNLERIHFSDLNFPDTDFLHRLSDYLSEYTEDVAFRVQNWKRTKDKSEHFKSVLEGNYSSMNGVNLDEELQNSIIIGKSYDAAARVMDTANDLFKTLLNSI